MSDANSRSVSDVGETFTIPLKEILEAFSTALDLMDPKLSGHHLKTCFVSCRLAEELGMSDQDKSRLFGAAIMHDLGAVALTNLSAQLIEETKDPHIHSEIGYILLKQFQPFEAFATIVRHHHVPWNYGDGQMFRGRKVDPLAHLLNLADRIAILEEKDGCSDPEQAIATITAGRGSRFHPDYVDAFKRISQRDGFWLDLDGNRLFNIVSCMSCAPDIDLDLGGVARLAKFYSRLIDTRSRFTSSHSSGVAAAAEVAGELLELSSVTCKKLRIAGYLHDIGKLAIPKEILEKQGALTFSERKQIESHSYFTRVILERVSAFSDIADWASNHHEGVDGSGYPYGHGQGRLDLASRILAVADVFTALREKRPYREGMSPEQTCQILTEMVQEGKLDREVVELFCDNFDRVDTQQRVAQEEEIRDLNFFWHTTRKSMIHSADLETLGS